MDDLSKEVLEHPTSWTLECKEHGSQEVEAGTLHQWDEETEKILRQEGLLAEGEHFCTGNCPMCHTTLQATEVIKANSHQSTSEHTEPS